MKVKMVPMRDNKLNCISALRYTNSCVKCSRFQQAYQKNIRLPVDEIIEVMKCKPIVTSKQREMLKERKRLSQKIQELKKSIASMQGYRRLIELMCR